VAQLRRNDREGMTHQMNRLMPKGKLVRQPGQQGIGANEFHDEAVGLLQRLTRSLARRVRVEDLPRNNR
jgi:hypothetical protein